MTLTKKLQKSIATGALALALAGCGSEIREHKYIQDAKGNLCRVISEKKLNGKVTTFEDCNFDGTLDRVFVNDNLGLDFITKDSSDFVKYAQRYSEILENNRYIEIDHGDN